MRSVEVYIHQSLAGHLTKTNNGTYAFEYLPQYSGLPVSLTMPLTQRVYSFDSFPAFFDGLLPEGPQLEGLLKQRKLDRDDYLGQLIAVGEDMIGAITIKETHL
jgi:serine/threonine-protein kinase HipA